MKVHLHQVELPLRHQFTIARGSMGVQRSLIVELEHDGFRGYGEAAEHSYYQVTTNSLISAVERCRNLIENERWSNPAELWKLLQPQLQHDMFALSAIDCAAHDLLGKAAGRSTFSMLDLKWTGLPNSSYTIGIDSIDVMVAKLEERSEWPIYKIKLGTDRDIEIVRQLRRRTEARFRIDANCGWAVDQTIENSHALQELGVEFIEQPLPAEAPIEDHRRVFEQSVLPVIADESCLLESDVQKCSGLFHGINVKLSKCGGLTPASRMLRQARALNMSTMVGCMVESSVGISAAAQLLPLLDYADLDGAVLLASDVAEGVIVDIGVVQLADRFGNGVELSESFRKYGTDCSPTERSCAPH